MVQVQLNLNARRGCVADVVQALYSVALSAQAGSPDTRCAVYLEAGRPEAICYTEEWPGEDSLVQRVQSAEFLRLLAIMETAAKPPRLEFRFVDQTRGLDYVEQLRLATAGGNAER